MQEDLNIFTNRRQCSNFTQFCLTVYMPPHQNTHNKLVVIQQCDKDYIEWPQSLNNDSLTSFSCREIARNSDFQANKFAFWVNQTVAPIESLTEIEVQLFCCNSSNCNVINNQALSRLKELNNSSNQRSNPAYIPDTSDNFSGEISGSEFESDEGGQTTQGFNDLFDLVTSNQLANNIHLKENQTVELPPVIHEVTTPVDRHNHLTTKKFAELVDEDRSAELIPFPSFQTSVSTLEISLHQNFTEKDKHTVPLVNITTKLLSTTFGATSTSENIFVESTNDSIIGNTLIPNATSSEISLPNLETTTHSLNNIFNFENAPIDERSGSGERPEIFESFLTKTTVSDEETNATFSASTLLHKQSIQAVQNSSPDMIVQAQNQTTFSSSSEQNPTLNFVTVTPQSRTTQDTIIRKSSVPFASSPSSVQLLTNFEADSPIFTKSGSEKFTGTTKTPDTDSLPYRARHSEEDKTSKPATEVYNASEGRLLNYLLSTFENTPLHSIYLDKLTKLHYISDTSDTSLFREIDASGSTSFEDNKNTSLDSLQEDSSISGESGSILQPFTNEYGNVFNATTAVISDTYTTSYYRANDTISFRRTNDTISMFVPTTSAYFASDSGLHESMAKDFTTISHAMESSKIVTFTEGVDQTHNSTSLLDLITKSSTVKSAKGTISSTNTFQSTITEVTRSLNDKTLPTESYVPATSSLVTSLSTIASTDINQYPTTANSESIASSDHTATRKNLLYSTIDVTDFKTSTVYYSTPKEVEILQNATEEHQSTEFIPRTATYSITSTDTTIMKHSSTTAQTHYQTSQRFNATSTLLYSTLATSGISATSTQFNDEILPHSVFENTSIEVRNVGSTTALYGEVTASTVGLTGTSFETTQSSLFDLTNTSSVFQALQQTTSTSFGLITRITTNASVRAYTVNLYLASNVKTSQLLAILVLINFETDISNETFIETLEEQLALAYKSANDKVSDLQLCVTT